MTTITQVASAVSVEITNGQPTTTSLDIATHFGKQHKDVLRAIANLDCSPEFTGRNFALSEYTDPTGRKLTQYRLTRDGFTFLCMGFTGKEAAKWKEAYITAFNAMEAELKAAITRPRPKSRHKALPGGLTLEQQEVIRAMVKARIESVPEGTRARGKAAATCWSALKSKFGCSYKEIAPEQFTDAISLVARVELTGELLPNEGAARAAPTASRYDYGIDWLLQYNHWRLPQLDDNEQLPMGAADVMRLPRPPLLDLLEQMVRDGHDIEAANIEYLALRHHLDALLSAVGGLQSTINTAQQTLSRARSEKLTFSTWRPKKDESYFF